MRKIIHIDMDAFFASVEQNDNPELRGKPVAVGGSAERGVVAAASYEARKFGVRSAMPSKTAARLCPELVFVFPRFDRYKFVSNQIREVFHEYTDLVEPLSLDEAFLDVTENHFQMEVATEIAMEIKKKIKAKTNLTASAGVSFNKFLAKTASDINKPDGLFVIKPAQALDFVAQLEVRKFFGIGKVTAERMQSMGIFTGLDLRQCTREFLVKHFGKAGNYYFDISRGEDRREVNPNRIRKSVGVENTFSEDLLDYESMERELLDLSENLWKRLLRSKAKGKTLTLKVKFSDFEQITRSRSGQWPFESQEMIENVGSEMLKALQPMSKGVRLIGLTVSNLLDSNDESGEQLKLEF
ncbi:DNA polymerase IV [Marinilongibacter aquaticus]|uniref:DNA polymerase IV n=1 Tax=Marinilongibacter aquaticus TaxID=2975157 RepID=UPI0035B5AEA2|nr:DNA polymerase IV [Marinilongibacter aquaticus]